MELTEEQKLGKELFIESSQKCLKMATDVYGFLVEQRDEQSIKDFIMIDVPIEGVIEVLKQTYTGPIKGDRVDAIAMAVAETLTTERLHTCFVWEFAHRLDHILY